MSGAGRRLGVAAVVVGLLGLVLGVGGLAYARVGLGGAVVSSESMRPTYGPGDRIFYERTDGSGVRRGDVVLLSAPDRYGFDVLVVKRVIGVGGDRVACCAGTGTAGRVTVNGKPIEEPYLGGEAGGSGIPAYDVRVPEGRLFLLGDNRANARDSRAFLDDRGGTFAESEIRGRATDGYALPTVIGTAFLLGVVLTLVGVGLGIGARVVRRRGRAPVPVAPNWHLPA
ncbi:signal peptidase I [Streptomyces sp. bgisy034]|uniref:signal peptidase I n=1 Tax=Streptomyces sp. bgisy034 TaxID=3413774 RepID=UPI003EC12D88